MPSRRSPAPTSTRSTWPAAARTEGLQEIARHPPRCCAATHCSVVQPALLNVPIPSLPPPVLSAVALIPILSLLGGLAILGWSASRSALVSFGLALALAAILYGLAPLGGVVAMAKGVLLSLFVLLVVWAALFLHALLSRLGAVESIGAGMVSFVRWPAARALLIGWGFSGFIQGFAGAGAPVAAVVPLLRVAGFGAISSVAAAMVGHSWAITFGSMGSSYFALELVTRIPGEELVRWLGALFILPIVFTGFAVLHILLGWSGVRDGAALAVSVGLATAGALWITASLGAAAVASIVAGLTACALLLIVSRGARRLRSDPASPSLDPSPNGAEGVLPASSLDIRLALVPYGLLIVLTLAVQAGPLAPVARSLVLGLDLPATATALGYVAPAELAFPRLRVFQHPAAIIGLAIIIVAGAYRLAGRWPTGVLRAAGAATVYQARSGSITVLFMAMMALVMADAGMISALASGLRAIAGPAFPILSPFLGVLGAFMTGANTSSNITMGVLQVETAAALGLAPALIAAAQSVGGSLGAGVSPDKAAIGASAAGAPGQEPAITRRALPYALGATALVGVQVLVLARLVS